jgi:hypothetical protein
MSSSLVIIMTNIERLSLEKQRVLSSLGEVHGFFQLRNNQSYSA